VSQSAEHDRISLSPPHMSGRELTLVHEAFDSNWIAPAGPHIAAFEREFSRVVNARNAVALASGTAALHLALVALGIGYGDEVWVSTLTFVASVNPIFYVGAQPVFIDSEHSSWNLDPELLAESLEARARKTGKLPKALIVVHLFGQSADMNPILVACDRFGVEVIEDAAEALGADYKERAVGTLGRLGAYSFNGNKIITTGGGGMLVSGDEALINHVRKLAAQARDDAPHYQHSEIGFTYRLSNILAAIGRGQLASLEDRVQARRQNFEHYAQELSGVPGIEFMPEAPWGRHTRWLTCITVDPARFGTDREGVRVALARENIEARPVWKPMHLQPAFSAYETIGGSVAEDLFLRGLCLPSGSTLTYAERQRIIDVIRHAAA